MEKLLYGLRCILLLTVITALLTRVNHITIPKYTLANSEWPSTSTYHQFYKMEKDTLDVLFFGASVAVNSFSPQELYNNFGITSYNLGSEQQSIFLSYFWLKEALTYQSPKVVVLDTLYLFNAHPENAINTTEGLTRKCLDPMRFSKIKRDAVKELCALDENQTKLSYYLSNWRFHTRWTGLSEVDFLPAEYEYAPLKGYGPIASYGPPSYTAFTPTNDVDFEEPVPVMLEYLEKFADLCRENDITLILTTIPGEGMNDARNNTLKKYSQAHNIRYLNMCEASQWQKINAELPRESANYHSNFWGAQKITNYIGTIIADDYKMPAHTDDQYEKTKDTYRHVKSTCELSHFTIPDVYLKVLYDKDFSIFIAASGDATSGLTEATRKGLSQIGLDTDFSGLGDRHYIAVIERGKKLIEATSAETLLEGGTIRLGKTRWRLTSGVNDSNAPIGSILINGTEKSWNKEGLNIVVYDHMMEKVVDASYIAPDGLLKRE